MDRSARETVAALLKQINQMWLEGRPQDMAPFIHPGIVMVLPGYTGKVEGREALVAGFVDFGEKATMLEYQESEYQVDAIGDTAIASFTFDMVYERSGVSYRSTGRDFWVFARQSNDWLAVWRTMLDVVENPV
jgi:hypothetical protein